MLSSQKVERQLSFVSVLKLKRAVLGLIAKWQAGLLVDAVDQLGVELVGGKAVDLARLIAVVGVVAFASAVAGVVDGAGAGEKAQREGGEESEERRRKWDNPAAEHARL